MIAASWIFLSFHHIGCQCRYGLRRHLGVLGSGSDLICESAGIRDKGE